MPINYQGSIEEKRALEAYVKLSRAAESVSLLINAHLRDYGLTVSRFGVLEAIYHLGPMQVGELGEKILKSSGNMTLVIDNLEKHGLVRREQRPDDRRCTDIHLTGDGKALVEKVLPPHVAGVVDVFGVLSPEEQDHLSALCRRLGLQEKQ